MLVNVARALGVSTLDVSSTGGDGQLNVEAETNHADGKADREPDEGKGQAVRSGGVCPNHDGGTSQRGHRVEIVLQHGGDLAEQDIAEHAPSDAGDGAKDDGLRWTKTELDRLGGSRDTEQRQTRGVEDLDDIPDPLQDRPCNERREPGGPGGRQVAPVSERRRWRSDQQVADDTPGYSDHHRQDQDAEQIQARPDCGESAADAEHEGADQVQPKNQRGVKALDHTWHPCP